MPTIQETAHNIVYTSVDDARSTVRFACREALEMAIEIARIMPNTKTLQIVIGAELRKRIKEEGMA